MKTITRIVHSALPLITVASFAFLPMAEAINPPLDGGYAGGNTAEGASALFSLTAGTFNTAVGFLSVRSNTEGDFNTPSVQGRFLATQQTKIRRLALEPC